ncbi:uncharacterized protein LAESUDRAFT_756101 [Laetiporus sulphureus 93-53]|uniref:Uncharacterized protein n=1 Tax=Laetiporus sulphureus 93-53 TaxID=1314785 RepID=A0A165G639_9APHY|nr:uncharacterized protein LAESUDRAFT_756101 [Laetiporus sulphureus 93-53]KZT09876.1 hypothetical protein LAESUDRAFT_756101 [Laetiporus sulphureus 93-53]
MSVHPVPDIALYDFERAPPLGVHGADADAGFANREGGFTICVWANTGPTDGGHLRPPEEAASAACTQKAILAQPSTAEEEEGSRLDYYVTRRIRVRS